MSHITGSVIILPAPQGIGPDFGSSNFPFVPAPASPPVTPPGGIKFVLLHFTNANFPANNRLEVDLGYGTDIFTAADGPDFWTRPINIRALPGEQASIRYITDGAANGGVRLVAYGRGERHEEEPAAGHDSYSNSDPFLVNGAFTEPQYDPFWLCNPASPDWENVAQIPAGDLRLNIARSVCMIVSLHGDQVSTCSATLIGPDLVISAAHCLEHFTDEIPTSSVTFDYLTTAAGGKPAGYNPVFHKVIKMIKFGNAASSNRDYIIFQIKIPAAGLGIPPVTMRPDLPAIGEQVFGIHHPNGAVKKISRPHANLATVNSVSSNGIVVQHLDVAGGSSGSGLFDMQGRLTGICSRGQACNLTYTPSANILPELTGLPPAPLRRNLMFVFDRSGSMSQLTATGRTKMAEAQDAAALFISLLRENMGDQVGLVSFSTGASSPVDFPLSSVNDATKSALVGPTPPFIGGLVGALSPGGATSLGGGLQAARNQFPAPGSGVSRPTIMLLTDGLENTPPMIANVNAALAGTDLCAIGFGTESNLNGDLLTRLTRAHNGLYARAANGLQLKKFFALCFGDIFEAGTLLDPEYFLPASQMSGEPVQFSVCEETSVTVIVGWDQPEASLYFTLRMPDGTFVNLADQQVEMSAGQTWVFARLPLPHLGQQSGAWEVVVRRPGGGEFPPPAIEAHFFVNITADGGPKMRRYEDRTAWFTGHTFNPLVILQDENGVLPPGATVQVTVRKPSAGLGNILAKAGLRQPAAQGGDTLPGRFATLQALESQQGRPIMDFTEETFELFNDTRNGLGTFEPTPVFGRLLTDLLRYEGNYTFHAKATFGEGCTGSRELLWSIHVDTGIDPTRTDVVITVTATLPDGRQNVTVTFTPRDTYGNLVGPGRPDAMDLTGVVGTTVTGGIEDHGDGSYSVEVIYDPAAGNSPGLVVTQPDGTPVVVAPSGSGGQPGDCRNTRRWMWIWMILAVLFLLFWLLCVLNS